MQRQKRQRVRRKVDYSISIEERRKLASYMKRNNVNQITQGRFFSMDERRNRIIFCVFCLLFFSVGLFFILF